jgi:glycosyltransferase involved in cell wall biosynthesis
MAQKQGRSFTTAFYFNKMMSTKMKITFILPNVEISGGAKAVFEFANHLIDRCHDVNVVYPITLRPFSIKHWGALLANIFRKTIGIQKPNRHVEWFDLKANLIEVSTLAERYMPNADIVVATWWETAYYVSRYNKSKGAKFYLAQHYEIWGGPKGKVDNSYKLGLRIIVNSNWLKNILEDKLGVEVENLILHSPDMDQFFPEKKNQSSKEIRILMAYRKIEWKGIKDGINAFEFAKEKYDNIKLVMFGPTLDKDLPDYIEFYEKPYEDKLREIYNSCDIFVFPSHVEGFGMPPMEAMLCKCAVVTTDVGAVPDYAIPGETALVSPPKSPGLLADNIIKLIEDEKLRKRISEAGYKHVVQNFGWDRATDLLEQSFMKAMIERSKLHDHKKEA